jgi:hypothetical protein
MADSGFVVRDRARLAAAYSDGVLDPVRMGAHRLTPFNGGELSFAPDRMFASGSYPSGGAGMSGTAGDFMRLLDPDFRSFQSRIAAIRCSVSK